MLRLIVDIVFDPPASSSTMGGRDLVGVLVGGGGVVTTFTIEFLLGIRAAVGDAVGAFHNQNERRIERIVMEDTGLRDGRLWARLWNDMPKLLEPGMV